MFVLGNLLLAAARIIDVILTVLYWLIVIRAIISWVNPDPFNPIVQFLQAATEPFLEPIRRLLPPMAIDISPIIAFLAVMFLQTFLVKTLVDVGLRFR
jgi:YggT family protein